MGYKWKATMYYSDEDTKNFLEDKALKPNGKKVSDSQYLYSLVNKARVEGVVDNDVYSENRLLIDDFKGIVLHEPFKTSPQEKLHSDISPWFYKYRRLIDYLSGFRAESRAIEPAIADAFFYDNEIREELNRNNKFCVLVVNKLTIYYCDNHSQSNDKNIGGVFSADVSPIYVDVNLWDKYSGKYYFDKIRYLRYEHISNSTVSKYNQFSKIHEMSSMDGLGGFFIPVGDKRKTFPSDLIGTVIVVGVEKRLGQKRVLVKQMTERRKNKYLSDLKKKKENVQNSVSR